MKEKNTSFYKYRAIFVLTALFCLVFLNNGLSQKEEISKSAIKTVCIDAGHGGKDPGCNGAIANEKTVCLNMALALGDLIKKNYPEIKVVYTRDKDVFVELTDRANIANKNNADLFICIHANSAGPSAYGSETYVLGLHRTDAQQKVMERENSIIHLEADGGAKYKDFDLSPDAIIAIQLQKSITLAQSINFASKVQKEFKNLGRLDRGVKQAGFLVLYKTAMPSVLIETGFLTNPTEEKFLATKENQHKMAESMFNAFVKYKNEMDGTNKEDALPKKPEKVEDKVVKPPVVETKKPEPTIQEMNNKVVFRVQIQTSQKRIPTTSKEFNGMTIYEYNQDGLYKYTTGNFINDFKSANNLKNDLRKDGFENAFVVAFLNGERIILEKAINLAEKK